MPRVVGQQHGTAEAMSKQKHRRITTKEFSQSVSKNDYYKRALTISLLDHLFSEMNTLVNQQTFFQYRHLCPKKLYRCKLSCGTGNEIVKPVFSGHPRDPR